MTKSVAGTTASGLRVGDLVEVRSAEEILATLDESGELENLPFMPEMLRFCGRRLTVHKVAHKLCDTISGTGIHRMENAVHLTDSRCDGSAHGGCQTACSLYWKDAWLKRVEPGTPNPPSSSSADIPLLDANTRKEPGSDDRPRYSCQATELLRAAPTCLPFRDLGQYVTDVKTGNVGPVDSAEAFLVGLFNRLQDTSRRLLPRKLWFRNGLPWGFVEGKVVGRTPTAHLNLQPGEMVRIKTKSEIMETLDADRLNRGGMGFEEEMARHCGRTARVQARVTRCIDEGTGELLTMKNPCIVLEGITCNGALNASCPREFVPFWREIWLERV